MLLRPISCHPELYPESMLSYSCASDNNGSKLFPDNWGYSNAEEACNVLSAKGYMLAADMFYMEISACPISFCRTGNAATDESL